jgi:hypothetical protein
MSNPTPAGPRPSGQGVSFGVAALAADGPHSGTRSQTRRNEGGKRRKTRSHKRRSRKTRGHKRHSHRSQR